MEASNPHLGTATAVFGPAAKRAKLAVILVHGRGQSPAWMRQQVVDRLDDLPVTWHAPAAEGASWYPERFIVPVERNEPRLSQALAALAHLSDGLRRHGFPTSRQVLMGFSQGACLCSEFVWRSPHRYRGLVAFTGGLIGAPGAERPLASLPNLPVLLSTWDADPHVPLESVQETAEWFRKAGAQVRLHAGAGTEHGIRDDEIAQARALLESVDASMPGHEGDR
ncbi:MAG: dienelactone hydrolase family protein [Proteobacteria bacterium]|nr:dienelactone hydrolase family protein [Pseudomonadota bacterium]